MKYSLVNFCEFDKYATKSYCAIHGTDETLNLGDITKVDETAIASFNMICGGSPCQDFSLAGKQAGSVWTCRDCGYEYNPLQVHYRKRHMCEACGSLDIDKTRSSLLVEWLRIIRGTRPVWGIYENVKNIVGLKFRDTTFKLFEEELHEYGYHTYWRVLNAKDYGIPQNRERVYLILIQKEYDNGKFCFPEKLDISTCLKDVLEDVVDEKYYLQEEKVKRLIGDMEEHNRFLFEPDPEVVAHEEDQCSQTGRVYSKYGCRAAVVTTLGKSLQPKIVAVGNLSKGYILDVYSPSGIVGTLMAGNSTPQIIEKPVSEEDQNRYVLTVVSGDDVLSSAFLDACQLESLFRIRRLTPLECFRLMGFDDEDFWKAHAAGISNSQLYKQTGNSIVVDVLFYICLEVYTAMPYLFDDVRLSSFFTGIGAFEKALERLEEYVNKRK